MSDPRPTRRLAAVAEAADNGSPWEWEGGYPQKIVRVGDVVLVADCYESPDAPSRFAQFIATFDPPTVRALVARITDLEAQVAALTQERDDWYTEAMHHAPMAARAKAAEAALAEARQALTFYAAEATYVEGDEPHPTEFATYVTPIDADNGDIARRALAETEESA